jgi:hypothetical protein
MHEKARAWAMVPLLLLVSSHFILLILRTDHIVDLSYYVIGAPAFAAYGGGALLFLVVAVAWPGVAAYDRVLSGGMVSLLAGSLWSQLQLAGKFQVDMQISYLSALLPFLCSLLFATMAIIAGLVMKSFSSPSPSSSAVGSPYHVGEPPVLTMMESTPLMFAVGPVPFGYGGKETKRRK